LALKVPWKKVLDIKNFFSGSSMILYNRVPGNKSSYSGKCVGTKDVYNYGKKGLDIINTPGYIQMHRIKGFLRLGLIFL